MRVVVVAALAVMFAIPATAGATTIRAFENTVELAGSKRDHVSHLTVVKGGVTTMLGSCPATTSYWWISGDYCTGWSPYTLDAGTTIELRRADTGVLEASLAVPGFAARVNALRDTVSGRGPVNSTVRLDVQTEQWCSQGWYYTQFCPTAVSQTVQTGSTGLLNFDLGPLSPMPRDIVWSDSVRLVYVDASGDEFGQRLRIPYLQSDGDYNSLNINDLPDGYHVLRVTDSAGGSLGPLTSAQGQWGQIQSVSRFPQAGDKVTAEDNGGVRETEFAVSAVSGQLESQTLRYRGTLTPAPGVPLSSFTASANWGYTKLALGAGGALDAVLDHAKYEVSIDPSCEVCASRVSAYLNFRDLNGNVVVDSQYLPDMWVDLDRGSVSLSSLTDERFMWGPGVYGRYTTDEVVLLNADGGVVERHAANDVYWGNRCAKPEPWSCGYTFAFTNELRGGLTIEHRSQGRVVQSRLIPKMGMIVRSSEPADLRLLHTATGVTKIKLQHLHPEKYFGADGYKEVEASSCSLEANMECKITTGRPIVGGDTIGANLVIEGKPGIAFHREVALGYGSFGVTYDVTTGELSSNTIPVGTYVVKGISGGVATTSTLNAVKDATARTQLRAASGRPFKEGDTIQVLKDGVVARELVLPKLELHHKFKAAGTEGAYSTLQGVAPPNARLRSFSHYGADDESYGSFAAAADGSFSVQWGEDIDLLLSRGDKVRIHRHMPQVQAGLSWQYVYVGNVLGTGTSVEVRRSGAVVSRQDLDSSRDEYASFNVDIRSGDVVHVDTPDGPLEVVVPRVDALFDSGDDRLAMQTETNWNFYMFAPNAYWSPGEVPTSVTGWVQYQFGVHSPHPSDLTADSWVSYWAYGPSTSSMSFYISGYVPQGTSTVNLTRGTIEWSGLWSGSFDVREVCGDTIGAITVDHNPITWTKGGAAQSLTGELDGGCQMTTVDNQGHNVLSAPVPVLAGELAADGTLSIQTRAGQTVTVSSGSTEAAIVASSEGKIVLRVANAAAGATLRVRDSHDNTWIREISAPVVEAPAPDPGSDSCEHGSHSNPDGGAVDQPDCNNGSGNDDDCEDDNNGQGVPGRCRDTEGGNGNNPNNGTNPNNGSGNNGKDKAPNVEEDCTKPSSAVAMAKKPTTVDRCTEGKVVVPAGEIENAVVAVSDAPKPASDGATQTLGSRGFAAETVFRNVTVSEAGALEELDIHDLDKPIRIELQIPDSSTLTDDQLAPAWFEDGAWRLVPKITAGELPRELQDGFWIERRTTGRYVVFLSRHLTEWVVLEDVRAPKWSGKALKAKRKGASAKLTWKKPTDNTGIAKYGVTVDGKAVASLKGTAASYTVKLKTGKHKICVSAHDKGTTASVTCVKA